MDVDSSPLEDLGMKKSLLITLISLVAIALISSCASRVLKYEKSEELKNIKEFDDAVKIVTPEAVPVIQRPPPEPAKNSKKETKKKKLTAKKRNEKETPERRQPDIENDEGFAGRRPVVDPIHVGERIVHAVSYFAVNAGTMTLQTQAFAEVNGKKSYHFRLNINSSPFFSHVYSVDDFVDAMLDFESLIPNVFTLHMRETNQLRESRAFFDHEANQVTIWERKVTKESGEEHLKLQWQTAPFAQNVFTAAFYMRFFKWTVGKKNAFWVANDKENVIFRALALRKEKIVTDVGEFNTIVVKPEIELPGKFTPVGDIFIWLSDDDRKLILRIESKIRIGTLVSQIIELDRGT